MPKSVRKSRYKLAVGLEYERTTDDAPKLCIKGERLNADEVVKIANRFRVPVVEDAKLANALNQLELDQQIPLELFQPVAVLLNELKRTIK